MIMDAELNEDGMYDFPYECPICKAELSPEENIDHEIKDGIYRSVLRCGNKNCRFQKILSEESEKDIEQELYEGYI